MGHTPRQRIILVLILLVLTGGLIGYLISDLDEHVHQNTLMEALLGMEDWTAGQGSPIGLDIQKELQLDEYINRQFINDPQSVFLYVGYYHTAKKVGAAHDPLVCFPGQGWKLGERTEGVLTNNASFAKPIRYACMVAEKGVDKQFLLYWFQSYDVACSNTLSQKIWLSWKKLKGEQTDNAFIRITVPMTDQSIEAAKQTALDFTRQFYPAFLEYVTSGKLISELPVSEKD